MSLRLYDLLEKIVYFQVSGVFKAQRSGEHNTDVQDDPLANYPLPSDYPLLTSCKSLTCFRWQTSTSLSRPWKGPRAERMRVNNQESPLPHTTDPTVTSFHQLQPHVRGKARAASRSLTANVVTQPQQLSQSRDEWINSFQVTMEFPTFHCIYSRLLRLLFLCAVSGCGVN